jgi:hypothetical protein
MLAAIIRICPSTAFQVQQQDLNITNVQRPDASVLLCTLLVVAVRDCHGYRQMMMLMLSHHDYCNAVACAASVPSGMPEGR